MPEILIDIRNKIPTLIHPAEIVTDNTDYTVRFTWDEEWETAGIIKTVFFVSATGENMPVVMEGNTCDVPMITAWRALYIGVQAGELHTTRPCAIRVAPSIARQIGDPVTPEEFDKWTQIMERLLSPVDKTAAMTQPVGKDADGKLWTAPTGGGGGGTGDHTELTNRDAPNQHPISAVTGLEDALDGKQPSGDYLTEEADPTVPAWAKQQSKPTYTAQEVGALPADTPIPSAVTESTVAGWGFTKNTGTYIKPADGIPESDLVEAVRQAIALARTALQEHQSLATYRTASAQDTIDAGKQPLINDLTAIRSGASAGAAAVQPGDDVSSLNNDAGYLTLATLPTYTGEVI